MNALIKTPDKRHSNGYSIKFMLDTSYEEIVFYLKSHSRASRIELTKSPLHERENDKCSGMATLSREEVFALLKQQN